MEGVPQAGREGWDRPMSKTAMGREEFHQKHYAWMKEVPQM